MRFANIEKSWLSVMEKWREIVEKYRGEERRSRVGEGRGVEERISGEKDVS